MTRMRKKRRVQTDSYLSCRDLHWSILTVRNMPAGDPHVSLTRSFSPPTTWNPVTFFLFTRVSVHRRIFLPRLLRSRSFLLFLSIILCTCSSYSLVPRSQTLHNIPSNELFQLKLLLRQEQMFLQLSRRNFWPRPQEQKTKTCEIYSKGNVP